MLRMLWLLSFVVVLILNIVVFEPSYAGGVGYGQVEQTGAYASGSAMSGPPVGR